MAQTSVGRAAVARACVEVVRVRRSVCSRASRAAAVRLSAEASVGAGEGRWSVGRGCCWGVPVPGGVGEGLAAALGGVGWDLAGAGWDAVVGGVLRLNVPLVIGVVWGDGL